MAQTSNHRVIVVCGLYCCMLPHLSNCFVKIILCFSNILKHLSWKTILGGSTNFDKTISRKYKYWIRNSRNRMFSSLTFIASRITKIYLHFSCRAALILFLEISALSISEVMHISTGFIHFCRNCSSNYFGI